MNWRTFFSNFKKIGLLLKKIRLKVLANKIANTITDYFRVYFTGRDL